jgi:hypothetical protein
MDLSESLICEDPLLGNFQLWLETLKASAAFVFGKKDFVAFSESMNNKMSDLESDFLFCSWNR